MGTWRLTGVSIPDSIAEGEPTRYISVLFVSDALRVKVALLWVKKREARCLAGPSEEGLMISTVPGTPVLSRL